MEPEVLLERARLLAERGRCLVEPNPLVGAIALDAHGVVAEGFHARYGGPHAEEVALERCLVQGRSPETLVVTLEPCSSVGAGKRRPPC
ncbi:MAG TPA: riboflavin biosynthesis protein RibD, partial [Planctomycetota bacterium]|nr:riboflavin biosynthesis protein RibD [Planctomycetota bacterium]